MLTKKENLLETIRGGNPDRFVNQYEYLEILFYPTLLKAMGNMEPGKTWINGWGVTYTFPLGAPGPIPLHNDELTVLKDITKWKEVLKMPPTTAPKEEWAPFVEMSNAIDRKDKFVAPFVAPGLFEKLHNLMGMAEAMINFYEEPEHMHDLIDYLVEYEIECAKEAIAYLKPNAVFHHDDWGSHTSSFLSPQMFKDFFEKPYKKIYQFWRDNGAELIVHHSDSYAANLVPSMIEMGVDIWQGVVSTNNIPELIRLYGDKIAFHGGFDNGIVDKADWSREQIAEIAEQTCRACGKHSFIPGSTMGLGECTFPGVYDAISEEIDRMSKILF